MDLIIGKTSTLCSHTPTTTAGSSYTKTTNSTKNIYQEPSEILSQWLGALESKSSIYWYQYTESDDVFDNHISNNNNNSSTTCKSIAHRDTELIAAITENCNHGPVCYFCRYSYTFIKKSLYVIKEDNLKYNYYI